jgi:hypothetical protein
MGALVESEPLGDGRFRDVFEDHGQRFELEAEIVRREPPSLFVVRLHGKAFQATSTQRLEPAAVGTRLTTVVETRYAKRLMRLAGPLIARHAQAQLERDLEKLKQLAEAG